MLVLSRRVGEVIVMDCGGAEVRLRVVQIDGHRVRLGIEAPTDVPVHRATRVAVQRMEYPGSECTS